MSNITQRQQIMAQQQFQADRARALVARQTRNRAAGAALAYDKRADELTRLGDRLNKAGNIQIERLQDVEGEMKYLEGVVRLALQELRAKQQQRAALLRDLGRVRAGLAKADAYRMALGRREKTSAAISRLYAFASQDKLQDTFNALRRRPYKEGPR